MRLAAATVFLGTLLACSGSRLAADPGELTSTLTDQSRVNVTIYNADLALVHDRRHVVLAAGENNLAWRDVSAHIEPTSALIESLTAPTGLSVIEQNFNFDLLSYDAMVKKAIGQTVTIVHPDAKPPQPQRETAKLLSDNQGLLVQYADRIEQIRDQSYVLFTSLPPGLRDRPTLVLGLDSSRAGPQDVELSYLTSGLSWNADYVGQVSEHSDKLDLHGLVTLTNASGATYRDAQVQLVAGSVNSRPLRPGQLMEIGRITARASNQAAQESFFEYHLYTLARPTTIADNQTKQVAFMAARDVSIRESLELRGETSYYVARQPDLGDKLKVQAYVTFENKGGELGVPLPGGLVRLYKTDSRGISQFMGADYIEHTPRNETVRLHVGDSFDVTARKRQTDFHIVSANVNDSSYEITLSNAKTEAVDVLVVEPIPDDWQILAESQPHEKSSSSSATWHVRVPAGGKTVLTYSARVREY
jgi:hypothetical protein